jgi:hypothetical protein
VGWGRQSCCFFVKNSPVKKKTRKHKMMRCHDATANPLVAKGQGEAFTHFSCCRHKTSQQYAELTFKSRPSQSYIYLKYIYFFSKELPFSTTFISATSKKWQPDLK